jgi:ketosteroid isomerase-like protein
MSEENVEVVRAGIDAFNRRDFDVALAHGHEFITWRPVFSVETDVLRGKQEILAAWQRQTETLDIRIDVLELTALDATRVVAVGRWRGRGSESGAPVELTAALLFTFEGELIRGVDTYTNRDEAVDAAT